MIWNQIRHHVEPEVGYLGKHLPFEGHRVGQDDIVCRQSVRRDNQQVLVIDIIDIADLAARD